MCYLSVKRSGERATRFCSLVKIMIYFPWGTRIQCPLYPCFHAFSVQFWIRGDVLRNHIPLVSYKDFKTRFSVFCLRMRRCLLRFAHPPPGSDEPTFFPGATRSQSPQGDSPISYLSLGIVCGYPSENITLFSLGDSYIMPPLSLFSRIQRAVLDPWGRIT